MKLTDHNRAALNVELLRTVRECCPKQTADFQAGLTRELFTAVTDFCEAYDDIIKQQNGMRRAQDTLNASITRILWPKPASRISLEQKGTIVNYAMVTGLKKARGENRVMTMGQ